MKTSIKTAAPLVVWIATLAMLAGCSCWGTQKTPTPPLGTQSDAVWRRQAAGAAASDFVIYQHEFELNGTTLNMAGEDHIKSIAARLHAGAPLPVIVERSMTSERPGSKHHYPVNPDADLDRKRRDSVVGSLVALGVANAEQCVVVAPAIAEGYTSLEASRAYIQSLSNRYSGGQGYGAAAPTTLNTIGTAGTMGGGGAF